MRVDMYNVHVACWWCVHLLATLAGPLARRVGGRRVTPFPKYNLRSLTAEDHVLDGSSITAAVAAWICSTLLRTACTSHAAAACTARRTAVTHPHTTRDASSARGTSHTHAQIAQRPQRRAPLQQQRPTSNQPQQSTDSTVLCSSRLFSQLHTRCSPAPCYSSSSSRQ